MVLLPLHGGTGLWDELVCLVVPATAIMGVALAVLRQQPDEDEHAEDATDDANQPAPGEDAADPANAGQRG